jgi:hypothetical protein
LLQIASMSLNKKIDTTGWSDRKLRIHQIAIDKLALAVENEKTVAAKSRKINPWQQPLLPLATSSDHFDRLGGSFGLGHVQ